MKPDLIVLGVVTRPHGLRGEARVRRFHQGSSLLLELDRVIVRAAEMGERELRVRKSRRSGDVDILLFEGCSRPEDAERLRGAEVMARRAWLPPLEEGEYYHADLVGLTVLEEGVSVGRVIDVIAYPSCDVLAVQSARGVIEIPILEPYVERIDIESSVVHVMHSSDFEPEG